MPKKIRNLPFVLIPILISFLVSAAFNPTLAFTLPTGHSVMQGIVAYLARTAVGVAGGFALLLLIFGGIKYVTSAGHPDAIRDAQDIITSALIGLLVILCSALILNTMGVALIPGWES